MKECINSRPIGQREGDFSVLMSLYYRERPEYLRQSLESVFGQTLPPGEVVLVEDGPLTPELDAVVAEYAGRYQAMKVVPLPQNVGLGKALNEGLKHCTHDLVARMDTDEPVPPQYHRQLVILMVGRLAQPECGQNCNSPQ